MDSDKGGYGSQAIPEDFSSAISVDSVEAAKLDARIYSADDFDGQAEGAASSGNFNYAFLQATMVGDRPDDAQGNPYDEAAFAVTPVDQSARAANQPAHQQNTYSSPTQLTANGSDEANGARA